MSRIVCAGACALLFLSSVSAQADHRIHLKYASFDPAADRIAIDAALRGGADTALWVVQFSQRPTEAMRARLRDAGATVHGYLPESAHVVRMAHDVAAAARTVDGVRWVEPYHPAFRLEAHLLAEHRANDIPTRRYNIVVVDKHTDKPGLIAAIRAAGGAIDHEQPGSILLQATLNAAQLRQVARMDQVLWIDRWSAPEIDMDNARIQGGADYVESIAGYTGQGIRGHIYESLEATHPDFTNTPTFVQSGTFPNRHGHCTAGIIWGNGSSDPAARGLAPDVVGFCTDYTNVNSGVSRWQVVQELVNVHQVMFTSASWGGSRVRTYTSTSADTDDIIFDHDITWTNSQSNAGNQDSRPEAWAKNIISCGGVDHFDTADPTDDSWAAGGGSTGPASDGRIKPDLCAYYDNILCSDLTGSAGYTSGNTNPNFGGTSGATPIVAGHNALAIQMFTDGVFGNTLRVPGGTRFENRPHATTLKALQIANATQYPFNASSTDNRREHQGWGFPSVRSMWDNRNVHFIVDETDVLGQGDGTRWIVDVPAGRTELKISMAYSDPAGNPAAALARINDLTLRVKTPSGTRYWGNAGLSQGNLSVPGGAADIRNTVENIIIASPEAGRWEIDVLAPLVAQDSHVETTSVDADYALVVNGGTFVSRSSIQAGSFSSFGKACLGSARNVFPSCIGLNETGFQFSTPALRANERYAIRVRVRADREIVGFDFQTGSPSGAQTFETRIMSVGGEGQPGATLATGSMTVGTATQWYTTTLATPVSVSAGSQIYLAFSTGPNPITAPQVFFGQNYGTYVEAEIGGWSRVGSQPWQARINCQGSQLSPTLSGGAIPSINDNYSVIVSQAAGNTPVAVILGGSNTLSPIGPLPIALGPLGAVGCSLLVSPDVLLPGLTRGEGTFAQSFDVPNNVALLNAVLYHQCLVLDAAANTAGLVTTNGIAATLGN